MKKNEILLIVGAIIMAVATGFATHAHINPIVLFLLAAVALVLVAMIVGHAT